MTAKLFTLPKQTPWSNAGAVIPGAKANFYVNGTSTRRDTYTTAALTTPNSNPVLADANGQFPAIYLNASLRYKVVLTDASDVELYSEDDFSDLIAASGIAVTDSGGYFAGADVETVLQDLGANYAKKSSVGTWTADQTFSGADLQMDDNIIQKAKLKDYAISHNVITSTSGVLTINLNDGNSFVTTLTENVTSMVILNSADAGNYCQFTLKVIQAAGGGPHTLAQPGTVLTPGGTPPTITPASGAIDKLTYETIDGATDTTGTWLLTFAQAYA